MAGFYMNGMDTIISDLTAISQLSDDEKWKILSAGAEIHTEKMKEAILRMFAQRTGSLRNSITAQQKNRGGNIVAVISPKGQHKGSSMGIRMKLVNGKRRSSGRYTGTNAEIGYLLEYGTPRIEARHWMETANEEAEEESSAAMQEAWNEILKDKGF